MSWYERHAVAVGVAVAAASPFLVWASLAMKVWLHTVLGVDGPNGVTP